ncbi:hypothetical protein TGAM01_v209776 [Trichoderma gamsii]|uniref:Uncharacterized protein n=1 Tax=Trichoderma gamsii TaxID=398673 RepID=A0A2P4ZAK6_9HYPO|nr:hypothetical protein TGAM01_v209776 [Trichoderma gamsii]PON21325.1 hypothetical protein TGAM01_v209776 [Trichoderma gamsii]
MDATPDSKLGTIISSLPVKRVAPKDVNLPWHLLVARDTLAYSNETQPCANEMTEDKQRVLCEKVMRIAFYIVGVDPNDYHVCLEACIEKAVNTKLLSTTAWTSWSGHRTLKARMKLAQQYTDSTKQVHCPPAPLIMAAVALKSIRKVEGTGTDETTILMEQYKTVDMAPTAIHNFVGNEERIVRIMFKLALPTTEQSHNITESLREVSIDVDSFRSSKHFEHGRRSIVAADNTIDDKETLKVEVICEMARDQAEDELKDILDLLRSKGDTAVTEMMGNLIKLPHMKVLSPANKLSVFKWAKAIKHDRVLGMFEVSLDDLDKYTWTETIEKPISTTWSNHPAYTIWNETRDLVSKKSDPKRILKRLDMLRETLVREAFEKQEESNKALPDNQTHAELLRDEIAAIKENLESVQRQNGSLKRQNDEVIQLLKDEKRLKPTCVFEDHLEGACI